MLRRLWEGLFGRGPDRELEGLQRRVARAALEAQLSLYGGLIDPREPLFDDPSFFGPYGEAIPFNYDNRKEGEAVPVYLTEFGLKVIRDRSRKLCADNEFAINAVTNRITHIAGKGLQYQAIPLGSRGKTALEPDRLQTVSPLALLAQRVIDAFISRNAWGEREQECVRRCDRDGEAFIRFFHVGDGLTEVRFIEPELIKDSRGKPWTKFGVITDPDDTESVLAYSVYDPHNGLYEIVPAGEVLHVKLNTDASAKRGLPTFYPVRKNLERAEKLLRNMSILAQVQSTFAMVRKHKQFSTGAVSAFRQARVDQSIPNPYGSGRNLDATALPPGAIIDTTDATDYEFPAARVDASSLVAILQAELRAVGARLVMPEYMLTTDASNGNFAGQLIAESPPVRNFESLQLFFARRFGDGGYSPGANCGALWRVLHNAVQYGKLPGDVLTEIELQVEGPSLVVRDKGNETNRARTLNSAGVLSRATWSKWEGLDREQEKRQLAEEGGPAPAAAPATQPSDTTPRSAPPGSAGGATAI